VSASANEQLALTLLVKTMGIDHLPAPLAEGDLAAVEGEGETLEVLVSEAVQHRPELLSLERQHAARAAFANAALGGFAPTLSAIGSVEELGQNATQLQLNWSFGFNLNWPLLSGGLTVGQYREAKGMMASVAAQLDAERLQVRYDVEAARLGIVASTEAISAADTAAYNARERLRLAEGRYTTGVGAALDQSDAQLALTQAQAQAVQQRFNLSVARAQLLAALGRDR
jgi:outer membrane protein